MISQLNEKNLRELWNEFSKVPINDSGKILIDWHEFSKGTNREIIWHWFEYIDNFSVGIAINQGIDKAIEEMKRDTQYV